MVCKAALFPLFEELLPRISREIVVVSVGGQWGLFTRERCVPHAEALFVWILFRKLHDGSCMLFPVACLEEKFQ